MRDMMSVAAAAGSTGTVAVYARTVMRALQALALLLAAIVPCGVLYGFCVALSLGARLGHDSGMFFASTWTANTGGPWSAWSVLRPLR